MKIKEAITFLSGFDPEMECLSDTFVLEDLFMIAEEYLGVNITPGQASQAIKVAEDSYDSNRGYSYTTIAEAIEEVIGEDG